MAVLILINAVTSRMRNIWVPVVELEAHMFRLASILYLLISTTLAGNLVTLSLTIGYGTAPAIVTAVIVGAALALPLSYLIAREMF